MSKIVIFGVGKIAQVVYTHIKDDVACHLQVAAFCVDPEYYTSIELFGLPVVNFDEVQKYFPPEQYQMLVAMGYHDMNRIRADRCAEAEGKGYQLVSYIDSKANVSSTAEIGKNCIIMNNASIEPFVCLGDNVLVYCNSTVAHHSVIGDNVWITSGVVIGGNSNIGQNSFLGINSSIGHNVTLGACNFVGAGALITKSSEDNAVFIVPDTQKHRLNTDQFMRLFKFG